MAYKTEYLVHPMTGEHREAPIGFSWTTLFFVFFPALIRGDFKWAIIMILLAMITGGISTLIFPFFYNNTFYTESLKAGFVRRV